MSGFSSADTKRPRGYMLILGQAGACEISGQVRVGPASSVAGTRANRPCVGRTPEGQAGRGDRWRQASQSTSGPNMKCIKENAIRTTHL